MFVALSVLLACTGEEIPPAQPHDTGDLDFSTETETDGGSYVVAYTTNPAVIPYDELFTLTVQVSDAAGAITDAQVAVDPTMPGHGGHGMTTKPAVTAGGDGTYAVEGMKFHMLGHWQIDVTVDGELARFNVMCCED